MKQPLTFATYGIAEHGPQGIYEIGANANSEAGVIQEMAQVFGHELSQTPETKILVRSLGR